MRAETLRHVHEAIEDGEVDGRRPAEVTAYLLTSFASGRAFDHLMQTGGQGRDGRAQTAFEALLDAA